MLSRKEWQTRFIIALKNSCPLNRHQVREVTRYALAKYKRKITPQEAVDVWAVYTEMSVGFENWMEAHRVPPGY